MRASVLLLTLLAFQPQDPAEPTLDQIIERMEKAAAAARGSSFIAETEKGSRSEPGLQPAEFSIANDGTVRIQEPTSAELKKPRLWSRENSMVLGGDSVYVISDELATLPSIGRYNGISKIAQRIFKTDCDRIDPFTEKWGAGAYHSWFWHAYFYALSPAKAFAFERNLKLTGRRMIGDVECYVLQSERPLDYGYSYESGGRKVDYGYVGQRRRFFISVADYRLKRFDEMFRRPEYVNPPVTTLFDAYDGAIPTRAYIAYGNNLAGWKVRPTTAQSIRRGIEGSLLPDPADFYATKVRTGDLADRLAKNPDDPDLLFSSAIFESNSKLSQRPDPKPFIEKLESVVAKRWAPTPVRNLLVLLSETEDREKLTALLDRVEKDPAMLRSAAPQVIRARIRIGDVDKAASLLETVKDLEESGLWSVRVELLLRKGDAAGAVTEYLKWPPRPPDEKTYGAFDFERIVKTAQKQNPDLSLEAVLSAIDAGIAKDPKSPRLHLTRLTMLRPLNDLTRSAEAAREAQLHCDDSWINWQACASIMVLLKTAADKVKSDPDKFLKALEPGAGRVGNSAARGGILLAAGNREAALAEFRKELDVLEKAGPEFASNAMSVTETIKDLKEDALLERSCRIHLGLYRKGEEQFRGFEWQHATNPLATLIKIYSESGKLANVYEAMKGMNVQRGFGIIWDMRDARVQVADFGAAMKAAAAEDKDPAGIRWFATMVQQSEDAGVAGMLGLDAVEWLERARAVDPEDVEILQKLAETYARKEQPDLALKAVGDIRAAIKAGAKRGVSWTPADVALFAAEQHLKNKDPKSAKTEILSVDWSRTEYAPWTGWQAAAVLEEVGEFDRALPAIVRAEEFGHLSAYRVAQHYLKKADYFEAMRYVNRALAGGYLPFMSKPGDRLGADMELRKKHYADKEILARELRDDIRAKAGARFFIDRLLATKLPAMTAEETARAEKALAALDTGNVPEREDALKEFKALGPKSAPVLIKMLKDEESIWRTAAQGLLNEWAEPR